jgi:large subunit ribosomal protein L35
VSNKTKGKNYKLKTHKSTAKRFKVTGSGKLVRTRGPKSHLRRNKSARTKNEFSTMQEVKGAKVQKRIRTLAPYLEKYSTSSSKRGGGKKR